MNGQVELKKEDAQKDLEKMMGKERENFEKSKEAQMSDEERKTLEAEKQESAKKQTEMDKKAKEEKELLEKKDEELSEEDRDRKAGLLNKQRKEEEGKLSSEDKIKHVKEETQKRIDEVVNDLKQVKDKTSKEADTLRSKLASLEQENQDLQKKLSTSSAIKDGIDEIVDKEEQEQIAKYLKEDKDIPREKRREMSEEEIEQWLLEEYGKATQWLIRRDMRRDKDKEASRFSKKKERVVKDFLKKQSASAHRVVEKHPELDNAKIEKREAELKAQGKNEQEIEATIFQENPKYKVCKDLLKKNPNRYRNAANAPELLAEDMEKVLTNGSGNKQEEESQAKIDELTKKVEDLTAEIARMQDTDDEGLNSTVRKRSVTTGYTPQETQIVQTMKEVNASQSMIDSAIKKHRAKVGTGKK